MVVLVFVGCLSAASWLLLQGPARPAPTGVVGRVGHPGTRAVVMAAGAGLAAIGLVGWWGVPVGPAGWWWLQHSARVGGGDASGREVLGAGAAARLRRELPYLVTLMVGPLRAGAAPVEALRRSCAALPGPAAERLAEPLSMLTLGVDPLVVWERLAHDELLGPLGRALARAERSGAAVTPSVERLAAELAAAAARTAEDRARTVGVRAAVPLGLCLLPAFLLLGVVPLAAGLFTAVLET